MFNSYGDILTVEELAKALGIGKNKAYELVQNHVIGYKKIGRKYLIPKSCLVDYVQSAQYTVCV